MEDLIVNLTPTGMVPTKEMTSHVPLEPKEIIEDVLKCAEIGVTMVHLHARDKKGEPTYDPEIYAEIIGGIRKYRPDLILGVSLSGRNFKEFDQRAASLSLTGELKPDDGSLTTSSLNFIQQESMNAPEMIKNLAQAMLDKGIMAEIEVFDSGMVNYAKYLIKKGLIKPPYYLNILFGNIANAQADLVEAGHMISQLPPESLWSFAGIGEAQLKMNSVAIAMGGGVRIGLEDNIWFDEGRTKLASNEMLVKRIKALAELHGRKIMAPRNLREKLNLHTEKGKYGLKTK